MNTEILEYFSVVTSMHFHFVIVFHVLDLFFFHFFFSLLSSSPSFFFLLSSLHPSLLPIPPLPFFCYWSLKNFWFPGTTSLLPKG